MRFIKEMKWRLGGLSVFAEEMKQAALEMSIGGKEYWRRW